MQVGRRSDVGMCESGIMLQGVPVLSAALMLTKLIPLKGGDTQKYDYFFISLLNSTKDVVKK